MKEIDCKDEVIDRSERRTKNFKQGKVPGELLTCFEDASAISCYSRSRYRPCSAKKLQDVPPQEREKRIAELRASCIAAELRSEGKCEKCMMQFEFCICASIAKLREKITTTSNVRFVVWMHHKERRRASNTGKLLELVLPDSSVVMTHGVRSDEEKLRAMAEECGGRIVVLFPSADAVPAAVALGVDATCNGNPDKVVEIPPTVVVLIDGTWNQAQRMHKHFEDLPHAVVSPSSLSQFHWRRQSQEGRISTVEAAALLLEEVGLAQDGVCNALHKSLAILMDALTRQCHLEALADLDLPEATGKKKHAQGPHRLKKRNPAERVLECSLARCDE
eukprot:TRINITY_DN5010_c1_g2_i1.p1 TRINITY_DN5010_c1_g2~~TRINITY_DN5010_c1_g2_i1.p1  ORF type:complete len:334 (+),score=65.94 TRINITY_DN5010_c1_g2_i1:59-1060(+)